MGKTKEGKRGKKGEKGKGVRKAEREGKGRGREGRRGPLPNLNLWLRHCLYHAVKSKWCDCTNDISRKYNVTYSAALTSIDDDLELAGRR